MVIRITPLAPLEPYNAVAEASFNTETDSTALGSIEESGFQDSIKEALSEPFPTTTPSITYKGLGVPIRELTPLIVIILEEPGSPLAEEKLRPATLPFKTSSTEENGVDSKLALETTL